MQESDLAVLWAAYKLGGLDGRMGLDALGEMDQEEFTDKMLQILSQNYASWIIEDKNHKFGDGSGPVGLMVAKFNGWTMEPHYLPFPWSTPRNKIKAVVAFMMKARYEKGVGVLDVFARENDKDFFRHLQKRYGVMYYVGKVPRGDYGADKYYFYGRGGSYFKGINRCHS
jgi:hypothetical protein